MSNRNQDNRHDELPTCSDLDALAAQGETLAERVQAWADQVDDLPTIADPENVATFLARCAVARTEAAVGDMRKALRGVEGQTPSTTTATAEDASEASSSSPVAGRMSKGNRTEIYRAVKLGSSSVYHALRTFGRGKGEVSICGSVKASRRTEYLAIRDLEEQGCEPCGRCFTNQTIPLPIDDRINQAKQRLQEAARTYRDLQSRKESK